MVKATTVLPQTNKTGKVGMKGGTNKETSKKTVKEYTKTCLARVICRHSMAPLTLHALSFAAVNVVMHCK